jgi:hypothetical protein
MKRFLTSIISILAAASLYAGTPAEDLMLSVADAKGVQVIEGKGFIMKFARSAIRKTPMGPLADQVTEVTVCKMEHASPEFIQEYTKKLKDIMKSYQFYGVKIGQGGYPVEVYGNYPDNNIVRELIVFNPELNSSFSLRGEYTVEELLAIDKNQ